jgi:hypothetical protein
MVAFADTGFIASLYLEESTSKSLFENSVWSPAFRRRGAETA